MPAAHLLIVDYRSANITDAQRRSLNRLGDFCYACLVDYCGYRGPQNQLDDYFGFDYADLFWSYKAELNFWRSVNASHDKVTTIMFGDNAETKESLCAYGKDCIRLFFCPECDALTEPLYDFMQLFQGSK